MNYLVAGFLLIFSTFALADSYDYEPQSQYSLNESEKLFRVSCGYLSTAGDYRQLKLNLDILYFSPEPDAEDPEYFWEVMAFSDNNLGDYVAYFGGKTQRGGEIPIRSYDTGDEIIGKLRQSSIGAQGLSMVVYGKDNEPMISYESNLYPVWEQLSYMDNHAFSLKRLVKDDSGKQLSFDVLKCVAVSQTFIEQHKLIQ